MYNKYKEMASFLIVYITEAHSRDEWPVGKTISFCDQPKTIQERSNLAKKYQEDNKLSIPVAVDLMENNFENKFAAWPVRFYVVQNGKLVFKAQPDKEFYGYDVNELSGWLERNV